MSDTPIYEALVKAYDDRSLIRQVESAWDTLLSDVPNINTFDIPTEEWPNVHSTLLQFLGQSGRMSVEQSFEDFASEEEFIAFNQGALTVLEHLKRMVPVVLDEGAE